MSKDAGLAERGQHNINTWRMVLILLIKTYIYLPIYLLKRTVSVKYEPGKSEEILWQLTGVHTLSLLSTPLLSSKHCNFRL